jgi:SNF2 family DNA or RNA helicase
MMALLCRDVPMTPTLITVPKAILLQWGDVLRTVCGSKVNVYTMSSSISPDNRRWIGNSVKSADVTLCTHGALKHLEAVTDVSWGRLIVDEAHVAKNERTKIHEQLTKIAGRSRSRWLLTATPIQNCLSDLIALSKLVGFASSDASLLREHAVITADKDDDENEGKGDEGIESEVVRLRMAPGSREAEVYRAAHERYVARRAVEGEGSRSTLMMELQMRCRLAATHPNLYALSLERKGNPDQQQQLVEATESTKIAYLVRRLTEDKSAENAVIYCEWRDEMSLVISALEPRGIECFEYHGGLDLAERSAVLLQFGQAAEENDRKPVVLVMQLRCSACGIDGLQSHISRVFFMRPYWNPSLERQAIGRVHRQGQARKVRVVKLMLEDTIDETCLDRQSAKLDCIEEALPVLLLNGRMRSMILGTCSADHGCAAGEADQVGADAKACAGADG